MKNRLLSIGLSQLSRILRKTNLGHGSTWPGHIALKVNPHFVEQVIQNNDIVIVFIAGTNGKTTTAKMLKTILEENNMRVFQNESGANLLNGVASALIQNMNEVTKDGTTYAIFEVDENALPLLVDKITPHYLVLLNLFRDQLDRYGEVRSIAEKWQQALLKAGQAVRIIANGDDPQLVGITEKLRQKTDYFGLEHGKKLTAEYSADSAYCPNCGKKLRYQSVQFSHLGDWKCPSCGLKRPNVFSEAAVSPLVGSYNAYNAVASFYTASILGIDKKTIIDGLSHVKPAFGRQEEFQKNGRTIKIFLSKNPTGMNESLRTIKDLSGKYLLFLLNDRIPDGKDVSWIWDVDIEHLVRKDAYVFASGDRAFDMGLRFKYAEKWQIERGKPAFPAGKWQIDLALENAYEAAMHQTPAGETLYIVPTYSAMLEIRKLLTGRKIL